MTYESFSSTRRPSSAGADDSWSGSSEGCAASVLVLHAPSVNSPATHAVVMPASLLCFIRAPSW